MAQQEKIAVLVSGKDTEIQTLIEAYRTDQTAEGRIALVIATDPEALALQQAQAAGISAMVLSDTALVSDAFFEETLLEILWVYNIGRLVLIDFSVNLSERTLERYKAQMIKEKIKAIDSHEL